MNRNKQLRWWGTNLRGLATGGLQYGLGELTPTEPGGGSDSAYTQAAGVLSICGLGP